MKNILTIDVEDYFMVSAADQVVKFEHWDRYEIRVVESTRKVLLLLNEYKVGATFFVLGWVAERYPDLIREIIYDGHGVASHGYAHKLVYSQSPKEFREDVRKAKDILENIIKRPVLGYRAPSYSIRRDNIWALDILIEEGFKYDSSIFPAYHARGGIPNACRYPCRIKTRCSEIYEFPISVMRFLWWNMPFSGGGYFRICPSLFIRTGIQKLNLEKQSAVIYLHPWEIDPDQPRLPLHGLNKLRHYVNLKRTEIKLRDLLSKFRFCSIEDFIKSEFS